MTTTAVVVGAKDTTSKATPKAWELTEAEILKLKAENPGIDFTEIGFPEYEFGFVLRAPSQAEFSALRTDQETSTTPYDTAAAFVIRHVAKPDIAEAQRRFEAHPAVVERLNARLHKMAGAVTEVTEKKL